MVGKGRWGKGMVMERDCAKGRREGRGREGRPTSKGRNGRGREKGSEGKGKGRKGGRGRCPYNELFLATPMLQSNAFSAYCCIVFASRRDYWLAAAVICLTKFLTM